MNNEQNLKNEFESMLDLYPVKDSPAPRTLVTGKVVRKNGNGYFVDLQMKSESFVSANESKDAVNPIQISVGCSYRFLVLGPADENGSVPLSREKALIWQELDTMRQLETITFITVKSISTSRQGRVSGLNTTINGIKAFIPKSEIPLRQNLSELINQEIPVSILETDIKQEPDGVVILSHRKALEAIFMNQIESFSPSETLSCQALKVMPAGVRVRILSSGLIGFVPRSELAFNRKASPFAIVENGDIFDAQILAMDMETLNIVLSRRQSIQSQFLSGISLGQKLKGRVSRQTDYAFFVEVGNCFDAILYKKDVQILGGEKISIKEGDLIEANVISIKAKEGKLILRTTKTDLRS